MQIKTADSFLPDPGSRPLAVQTLHEAGRELPILGEVDVLVCGGGPGGIGAAAGAARAGAKTLLLERWGCLGGMATGGLVVPHFDGLLNDGINREIIERLKARKA